MGSGMKILAVLVFAGLSIGLVSTECLAEVPDESKPSAYSEQAYIPGQVIVMYKGNVTRTQANWLARRYDSQVLRSGYKTGLYLLSVPTWSSVEDMVRVLQQDSMLSSAGPNFILGNVSLPANSGLSGQGNSPTIRAREAWGIGIKGSEIVVAVIGPGAGVDLEDLDERTLPRDGPVKVLPLRTCRKGPDGQEWCDLFELIDGIYYAVDQGVDVISLKVDADDGGGAGSALCQAVSYANSANVTVVASASREENGTGRVESIACDHVIAVAPEDSNELRYDEDSLSARPSVPTSNLTQDYRQDANEGRIDTAGRPTHVPGQLIIKFRDDVNILDNEDAEAYLNRTSSLQAVNDVKTLNVDKTPTRGNVYLISFDEDISLTTIRESYLKDPNVEFCELNHISYALYTPNDPEFQNQWGLSRIQADDAWDFEEGSDSTVIAIIDTGVDLDHPDLADKLVPGYDFVDWYSPMPPCDPGEDCYGEDSNPDDYEGHGTHVAGIPAANTNNAVGVAGTCPGCKIMPLRAGYSSGGIGLFVDSFVFPAIEYATINGADIINMSFGAENSCPPTSAMQLLYLDPAHESGIVVVSAAGNDDIGTILYPANCNHVIAVGATDQSDQRAVWGGGYASNYGPELDVAAPGTSIRSTLVGGSYEDKSGTSMSTPFVAGLAALLISKGTTGPDNITKVIQESAVDLGDPGFDDYYGWGRIDALAALQYSPFVTVTYPDSGDTVFAGITHEITWTATDTDGVDSVSIYYSTDGGDNYTLIASGEPNDGVYPWLVPGTLTNNALVKVIAYDPNLVYTEDASNDVFSIAEDLTGPEVAVISPNGGETWYGESTHDITWTATDVGGVDSVNIYYSVNGGGSYDLISSGETNDGTYSWLIPNTFSDSALVKVIAYDPSLNTGEDVSSAFFAIADSVPPVVAVIAPNGGEVLTPGQGYDITWTASDAGGVDSVSVYCSTDGGDDYTLLSSGEPNDGQYPWSVSPTPSDSCLVRVTAYDNSLNSNYDDSDGFFSIAAPVSGLGPGGQLLLGVFLIGLVLLLWRSRGVTSAFRR